MIKALLMMLAFILSADAHAQSLLVGAGATEDSCGAWLAARRDRQKTIETIYITWVQGYMSGSNKTGQVNLPAHTVIAVYLDKKCSEQPTMPVWIHAVGLMFDLERQQRPRK